MRLFAVARWLLCLLSDYKSGTCSERSDSNYILLESDYILLESNYVIVKC